MDQIERSIFGTRIDFLPNIGQMIEFLGEDYAMGRNIYSEDIHEDSGICRELLCEDHYFSVFEGCSCCVYRVTPPEKLCDALWEAVKYKLRN